MPAINSYFQGSAGGGYTVQTGDTLQSIAARMWGDASLWWKLAEANGLSGSVALAEGQTLMLPTGAIKNTHNASTFTPYNPSEIIGNTSPTTPVQPKPPKKKGCGGIGAIILVVIAVVVTIWTAGAAAPLFGGTVAAGGTFATRLAVMGGTAGLGFTGAMAVGAIAGAAGSIVSQAVGVVTGIQDKFSWSAVAMAAIGGAIGGGLAKTPLGNIGGWQGAAVRGAAGSALSQGIGVATGLQDKFSWAGVAAAGVGSAVGYAVGKRFPGAATAKHGAKWYNSAASSTASAIANSATRSLIEGSDFGDNLMAALPDIIGQTIGEAIAGGWRDVAPARRLHPTLARR